MMTSKKILCLASLLFALPVLAAAQVSNISGVRNGTGGLPSELHPGNQFSLDFYHDTAPVQLTGFQVVGSLPPGFFVNLGCGEPDPIEGERFQYLWAQTNFAAGASTTIPISSTWIPAQFYVHAGETCSFEASDYDTESLPPPQEIRINYQWAPCVPSSSSSDVCVLQRDDGFSFGEIVASVFLFLIFITLVYRFVFEWIHGIRVRPANKA